MKNLLKYSMMFIVVMSAVSMTSCSGEDESKSDNSKKHTDKVGNSYRGSGNVGLKNNDGLIFVDLGLSVAWAKYNVGASIQEEAGYYFAWGETTGYNTSETLFSWTTYKWSDISSTSLNKYSTNEFYGSCDGKTVLGLDDDAASVNWGAPWRMPTKAEWDELRDNCTWVWKNDGVNGYEVTSNINGNSIFLPVTGFRRYNTLANTVHGYYWSSSMDERFPSSAFCLYFDSNVTYSKDMSNADRYFGLCVRAVCELPEEY